MTAGVYLLVDKKTGKAYVGSTGNLLNRRAQHYCNLKKGRHHNPNLQLLYNQNVEDIEYIGIPTETKALAQELEQLVLDEAMPLGRLLNKATDALNPGKGWERPVELRKRIAINLSIANKGKKKSPAHIEKMRLASTGKVASLEARLKMSVASKGRKMPEHLKEKLRLIHTGRKRSAETAEKLRLSYKPQIWTDERREKLKARMMGNIVTEESRRKISEANLGKSLGPKHLESVYKHAANRSKPVVIHGLVCNSIQYAAYLFDVSEKTVTNRIANDKYPNWGTEEKVLDMNTSMVSQRVVGDYPLSIGTSLAVSGAVGKHPDHPEQTKNLLLNYQVLWINLKTLFRNFYEAINRDQVLEVNPQDLYDGFESEVDQFERVIDSESQGRLKVIWYTSDYSNMKSTYPHAILRGDVTNLQKAYTAAMISIVGPYIRAHRAKVKTYTLKIKDDEQAKALILTHFPLDLFAPSFRNLSLLESHTGAIKAKHLWYTKYLNGKELSQIPFTEQFIQVFGDKEHFRPWSINIRKQILEIADKYKWSPMSTSEKINYGLDQLKDHYLRDQLKQLK